MADLTINPVLQGRFSELKNEIDDKEIKKYEHYLDSIRKTFAENPDPEDFYKRYLTHAVPEWVKFVERIDALVREGIHADALSEETSSARSSQEDASEAAEGPSAEEALHEETSPEAAGTSGEVYEDEEFDLYNLIDKKDATDFMEWVFSLNDLEFDEDPEDRLDDPIVAIPVSPSDYSQHPMLRTNVYVTLEKTYDLYIDEWSVLTSEDPDEDFFNEYYHEALEIISIHALMLNLTESPPSGKADMESFARMCGVHMDMESGIFDIDASDVAEDLAKILEKNGVIKIKGDTIRWKKA
ncbi:MAG: hypothetical protein NQU42_08080 [Methanothrix sp.]|uniref:hypothetical protein n=1 Tax=Methanothrix sp. TaxID=90426 RepID=UPI0025D50FB9|nr:hypothetical protein [Methanothrix sp.]MCQ8904031.1 hypothetical protein [Methanothrix sp.]